MTEHENSPRIEVQNAPQGARVVLHGRWSAAMMARHWKHIEASVSALRGATQWELRTIVRMDHTAAQWLWNTWGRTWPAQLEVLPAQRAMLERVARFTVPAPAVHHQTPWEWLASVGLWGQRIRDHLVGGLRLVGQLALDIGTLVRHPHLGPWRDLSGHIYRIGATALPITAAVGFLIGLVLAYLMSKQLRTFGADIFIVNILGLSVIRELGPVLAAILLAGRSGSAITAQIGVMRVTEEIDAMRVMGIARGFRLVMPRALAMVVVMPLVSVWTILAALMGGMVVADVALGLTPGYFINALPKSVGVANLWLAVGKSAVFGLVIALVGCHYGLRVLPNTQSLGEGTTASVVTSITMVIIVNAIFAILFRDVGI
jgi:phospholipid/cholesterol/gamma-HCH transport system permease protein